LQGCGDLFTDHVQDFLKQFELFQSHFMNSDPF
jgi:hypothetical protein